MTFERARTQSFPNVRSFTGPPTDWRTSQGGLIAALFLLCCALWPANAAAQRCDEFCTTLHDIIRATPGGFASLLGEASDESRIGTAVLPGAIACTIGSMPPGRGRIGYVCKFGNDLTVTDANAQFEQLVRRVQFALPFAYGIMEFVPGGQDKHMQFFLRPHEAGDIPDMLASFVSSQNRASVSFTVIQREARL